MSFMKKIRNFLLLSITFITSSVAFASTPDQEKAFVEQYKKAFEAKDAAKLESFLYTKDANPEALEFFKMMATAEMGAKIAKIELLNLTPEEKKEVSEVREDPITGKSKLPLVPTKKLVLNIETKDANGSSSSSSQSFVAELDGKFVIPVPVTVK